METPFPSPASPPQVSILLVDDHVPSLVALEAVLEPLGQRLVRARSGKEALRLLLLQDFACCLLDVQMPELDGFETARLIKERPRTRHLPILFLTGVHRDEHHVLRGYAHGAVDYILKPYNPDVLRTKVAVFVDLFQQGQLLRERSEVRADPEREVMGREAEARLAPALAALRRDFTPLTLVDEVVSAAPVGLAVLSPELRYLRLNAALAQLHRTTVAEATGRSVYEVAPDVAERVEQRVREVLRTGRPALGFSYSRELSPGERLHVLASYYPLEAGAGRAQAVGVVATDVTALKEAEEAERASEERLRLHLDGVKEYAIFMVGTDGIIQSWNPGVERVNGYREEEFVGLPFAKLFPPELAARGEPRRELEEAAREGVYEGEGQRLRKDGTRFDAEVVLRALRGPDGRLRGYVKVARDISERKRAELRLRESEHALAAQDELLRTLADNVTTGLFMMDEQGRPTYMNPAAEQLTGFRLEEIRDRPLHDAIHHHHPDGRPFPKEECPIDRALPHNNAMRAHEAVFVRKDGTFFPVLVAVAPIREHGGAAERPVGTVVEVRDVTAQRQQEAERTRLLREAQEAVRLRDEFLSVASHELKTPLTPLHLRLASLQRTAEARREGGLRPERVEADVAVAQRQVRRLASLIDDLLDVSRLTQGRLTLSPERVDLVALVRDVVGSLEAEAAWSGCRVSVDVDAKGGGAELTGSWDPVRLEQVVTNLLTNALKYGAGKPVRVQLAREGTHARLSVQDEGIGIEPEALPRVFGKFVRAVSERHYGGLGLGLYITRQIVEAHGGSVAVDSRLHEGARFTVLLPLSPEPRSPELRSKEPAP